MAFTDIFKGKQYKSDLEILQRKYDDLQSLMSPDVQNAFALQNKVREMESTLVSHGQTLSELLGNIDKQRATIATLDNDISKHRSAISDLDATIARKKSEIICLDDEILVQEFGLYKPQFEFSNVLDYKDRLNEVRAMQKAMIKGNTAVRGNTDWQVNGSSSKGRKMVTDTQKLLLRAFNTECDELVSKVKYTNFKACLDKIHKSADTISKLGVVMNISIDPAYVNLKARELRLAFEYQSKKQAEKEEQREARAELREAAKLQKEIEAQRIKIEKEQTHYQTVYEKLMKQLSEDPDNTDLISKKIDLEKELSEIEKAIKDVDYRAANQRAGYVYIISNIGAFGENVYKIGMTRRLDPQDRIDELGDASVPFNFDVHAMIFSDDAPALENALHKTFEDKKLNMVNQRREFFNVTLDEIKEVVKKNFDQTVEFIDVADAEQYRISQKMKASLN